MKSQADLEQAIAKFCIEFLNLRVNPTEVILAYALTSMQQYELLVFIEQEFGVLLDMPELAGATVNALAAKVVSQLGGV
jgi:acyl carrier protein